MSISTERFRAKSARDRDRNACDCWFWNLVFGTFSFGGWHVAGTGKCVPPPKNNRNSIAHFLDNAADDGVGDGESGGPGGRGAGINPLKTLTAGTGTMTQAVG